MAMIEDMDCQSSRVWDSFGSSTYCIRPKDSPLVTQVAPAYYTANKRIRACCFVDLVLPMQADNKFRIRDADDADFMDFRRCDFFSHKGTKDTKNALEKTTPL